MYSDIRQKLHEIIAQALHSALPDVQAPAILIELPADKQFGDYSCNIAMQLSRILKRNPVQIASQLIDPIKAILAAHPMSRMFDKVELKAPGFINFYLSPHGYNSFLVDVFAQKADYGKSQFGQGTKFCLEFVSANPTGPLTVAHGRQAAVGDTLVNILNATGFDACREYYVNDEGNQINILGRSIYTRGLQILGEDVPMPEDYYQGDYIRTMAQLFINERNISSLDAFKAVAEGEFRKFGVAYLMDVIRKDLESFNVNFDVWSYQSKIAHPEAIKALLVDLKIKDYVYEQDGALWFKSTLWKDDKDRVVQKSNGDYTYLTPDIVYHKDKFARGFRRIVNILGPDHHGYIPRIKAAAAALGRSVDDLDVLIVQLATIFRDGKEVSMSTRRGEFITLREVIDEVGKDAGRFFFLMRQASAHLEFDLELAKRQSAENPVFYIQYAHARIHSIIRKAATDSGITVEEKCFDLLIQPHEIDLQRKLGLYPEVLIGAAKTLEPFALVRYLQELAGLFHKFYDHHKVLDDNQQLARQRLGLIEAVRLVLSNGLTLLGVSRPEKM